MKTNKITATIVIEIEDNRTLAGRCWCPITEKYILQSIDIGSDDHFTVKTTIISFECTNPLTDSDIRTHDDMSRIRKAVDACTLQSPILYGQLFDELGNWNWRQDCSN